MINPSLEVCKKCLIMGNLLYKRRVTGSYSFVIQFDHISLNHSILLHSVMC